jgi:ankyrin repeat protein
LNQNEETALHRACELEDLDFVGMLVRAGADLDIRNNVCINYIRSFLCSLNEYDKKTPVDIARHKFYPRGVELLEVFVVILPHLPIS